MGNKGVQVRLDIILDKDREMATVTRDLDFPTVRDFMQFKSRFHEELVDKGWARVYQSASQHHKDGVTMTPFFIERGVHM